jgi:hypothetical protein
MLAEEGELGCVEVERLIGAEAGALDVKNTVVAAQRFKGLQQIGVGQQVLGVGSIHERDAVHLLQPNRLEALEQRGQARVAGRPARQVRAGGGGAEGEEVICLHVKPAHESVGRPCLEVACKLQRSGEYGRSCQNHGFARMTRMPRLLPAVERSDTAGDHEPRHTRRRSPNPSPVSPAPGVLAVLDTPATSCPLRGDRWKQVSRTFKVRLT